MSDLSNTDLFVVERNGTNYKLSYDQMSTLQDSDLFVVERGGTNYKVKAEDVTGPSGYFDTPVAVLTPLNGAGLNAGQSYEPLSSLITGKSGAVLTFTDNTELSNIIGPVRMVDANGDVKVPVTSAVTNVTAVTGEDLFVAMMYGGNGGSNRTINTGIDLTAGGLTWVKGVSWSDSHHILDTGRGNNQNLLTNSNTNQMEASQRVSSFTSNGIVIGTDYAVNKAGQSYISYNFKQSPGFLDIVTYVGDGTTNRRFDHGLAAIPAFVLIKNYSNIADWAVYHHSVSMGGMLNNMDDFGYSPFVNAVTDTYAELGGGGQSITNYNGHNYVAYLFASDDTNIKCGSYTGTGGTLNVEVGFEIGWLLTKRTDSSENWHISDSERKTASGSYNNSLWANKSDAENNNQYYRLDSTSFRAGYAMSSSGANYIYVAIRKGAATPDFNELTLTNSQDLQFLKAGDTVTAPGSTTQTAAFSPTVYTGNNTGQTVNTGIDNTTKSLVWIKSRSASVDHMIYDTVRGVQQTLRSNSQSGQLDYTNSLTAFTNSGFTIGSEGNVSGGSQSFIAWNFRAAPSFMDIVSWIGDGNQTKTLNHQLGTAPGLIITKEFDDTDEWYTWHQNIPNTYFIRLNDSSGESSTPFQLWDKTDTTFMVNNTLNLNRSGSNYIAYLFALTGPSVKCGSYIGNNGTTAVNVGFQPGWVMIKNADSTGSWNIFDSARGLTTSASGDITALFADSTNTGGGRKLSATSTGFTITADANSDVNSGNQKYLYVAIKQGATAGGLPASGTLVEDADVSAKTVDVAGSSFETGSILTGPTLNAVSNNVTSQSGNTLTVDTPTGTGGWRTGLYAEGATITRAGPSPSSIVFTSMNGGSTPVTGVNVTLARRYWTLESSNSASGPWTVVGQYSDSAANASQDGATPWGNPTLTANTFYQVKVRYDSADNADPVESLYNTFRTGNA